MNQMDEREELSLVVIDPFAPGMIQNSFGHFSPHLLFNTPLKALKTVWPTWCEADRMRCYQFE